MIPKVIHYCWFGRSEKPKLTRKCIESWKRYCPDYEIIEWNEDNFDVNANRYVKEAYNNKKFAFVSDYVRLFALYNYGGIYMDTDVEVLKNLDFILNDGCVFGFEEKNYIATSFMAAESKSDIIKEFLDIYSNIDFDNSSNMKSTTNVVRLTELLKSKGFEMNGLFQKKNGVSIYPQCYFSPYDYVNYLDNRTEDSCCIHWFYVSWRSNGYRFKMILKKSFVSIFGGKALRYIRQWKKK